MSVDGLRAVREDDSAAVIELIGGCFAEYPGCVLDLDGIDAWMRVPASSYAQRGGECWVVERAGCVVACAGYRPAEDGSVELKSLYVAAVARRGGLGARLVALVEDAAARAGAHRVTLWSDTRFGAAHRLYERLGYERGPATRELHDPSQSVEFGYAKDLPLAGAR